MRTLGGLVGGVVAGLVVMLLVALLGGFVFPQQTAVDLYNARQVSAAFGGASLGAQIFVLLSWALGAFAGAAVAKKISGLTWAGWAVTILFTLYVIASMFVLPMPAWMRILAVILPLVAGYFGANMRGRSAAVTDNAQI